MKTPSTGNKLYDTLLAVNRVFGKIEAIMAEVTLILLVAVCVIFISSRFIFHVSTPWADELSRDFLILLGWLGAAYAASNNDHLNIDLIGSIFKNAKNKDKILDTADRISQVLTLVFLVVFMYYYGRYTAMQIKLNQPSSTLPFGLWVPISWVLIGGVLLFVHTLVYIILPKKYWPKNQDEVQAEEREEVLKADREEKKA